MPKIKNVRDNKRAIRTQEEMDKIAENKEFIRALIYQKIKKEKETKPKFDRSAFMKRIRRERLIKVLEEGRLKRHKRLKTDKNYRFFNNFYNHNAKRILQKKIKLEERQMDFLEDRFYFFFANEIRDRISKKNTGEALNRNKFHIKVFGEKRYARYKQAMIKLEDEYKPIKILHHNEYSNEALNMYHSQIVVIEKIRDLKADRRICGYVDPDEYIPTVEKLCKEFGLSPFQLKSIWVNRQNIINKSEIIFKEININIRSLTTDLTLLGLEELKKRLMGDEIKEMPTRELRDTIKMMHNISNSFIPKNTPKSNNSIILDSNIIDIIPEE